MYASVRRYAGNSGLASALEARKDEVTSMVSQAAGFRAYYLIAAGDDTISVTICDDEAGTNESNDLARNWLSENMPDAVPSAPEISAGQVVASA